MSKPKKTKGAVEEPKPWAPLPIAPKGDPLPQDIYVAVGTATSAWERLDEEQQRLFGVLVNSRLGAAEAAYGTIEAARGRQGMVIAAARQIFESKHPLLEELIKLISDIGEMAARRNEIAHGVVTVFMFSEENQTCYLTPSQYATKKRLPHDETLEIPPGSDIYFRQKYAYTAAQVSHFTGHFHTYRDRVRDLRVRISNACARHWPSEERAQLRAKQTRIPPPTTRIGEE